MGSAIASIASIEIPRREWLDLIPTLANCSVNDQLEIRCASLETLGFICEELSPEDMLQELKSQVI